MKIEATAVVKKEAEEQYTNDKDYRRSVHMYLIEQMIKEMCNRYADDFTVEETIDKNGNKVISLSIFDYKALFAAMEEMDGEREVRQ